MTIIESNEHFIVGTFESEPQTTHIAVTRPVMPEAFPASPAAVIPLRWLRRAQALPPQMAQDFLRRKLRTGNVGRKLRRMIRRQSS